MKLFVKIASQCGRWVMEEDVAEVFGSGEADMIIMFFSLTMNSFKTNPLEEVTSDDKLTLVHDLYSTISNEETFLHFF